MSPLLRLIEVGQSYWIDNLTRRMITSGELQKRITREGLRGMTSNPAIFNKAISKSSDYDEQIKELTRKGSNTQQIFERLAITDVQEACDQFRPVYDSSGGIDGYVSLEVSPYLARHTQATMAEARRLFKSVNRPNCFIKIPGTAEGLPAIEEMLVEGINVNITLLFSIKRYEAVAETYIRAIQRREKAGENPAGVASVASFFVSRMDVLVDQLLMHRIPPGEKPELTRAGKLLGKTAVANARMAYQSFKKIFGTSTWQKLADKGARVQRPLWASTSTKNPDYPDIMYVEPLVGVNTVNTMPEDTIAAFADHGKIVKDAVEQDIRQAQSILGEMEKLGINVDYVTQVLEDEGIQKFIEPFDQLLNSLQVKKDSFQQG